MNHLMISADARTRRLVAAYENLQADRLPDLLALYAPSAQLRDPFNDIQGREAIEHLFRHMFSVLTEPRFSVSVAITEADQAFLVWDFEFRPRVAAAMMRIHGCTHLHFAADGLVQVHRDYWDAAEELYAKLPVLGAGIRWLQRRLRAPQAP
jgi:steroid Delta-isomerase